MKRFIALLFLAFAPLGARAAHDGAVSLSPAVIMLSGEPGQSTTQTLSVVNGTSRPFSFVMEAKDVVTRDGKRVFVEAGKIPGSIAATAVFSQRKVTVAPGERASVALTLTLPPNAAHRAVVALFRGTNRVMSGNVPMIASLGALLTFRLSDRIDMAAEALRVRPQSRAANLAVTHLCTNSGAEPVVARGMLAIVGRDGAL